MLIYLLVSVAYAFFAVVSNGLWVAPGNLEEVAAALCQALRNSLERFPFFSYSMEIAICLVDI